MSEGGTAPVLRAHAITRRFDEVAAVDRFSLSLAPGEFVTLLGPSGCGKTTALRLIAGFDNPDEGTISFRGQDVTGWSPQRRGFGMVFQNYALFPHLDVFENVAFGLRARKRPDTEIRQRVAAALSTVDLSGLEMRAVHALSGGQQQRVALARALAIEPPILLLDEPLSNLDQALRYQTRTDVRRLVKELEMTALFVTHDQEEAFDLSDRVAVMNRGTIRQVGTPRELYERPADLFVAGFVGRANAFDGRRVEDGVEVEGAAVWPATEVREGRGGAEPPFHPGAACRVLVRPEDLEFASREDGGGVPVRVVDRRFRGASTVYLAEGPSGPVEVLLPADTPGPGPDDRTGVRPRGGARVHMFDPTQEP